LIADVVNRAAFNLRSTIASVLALRYQRWMNEWEATLAFRDTDRITRPFEWGIEWAQQWPLAEPHVNDSERPDDCLLDVNRQVIADSRRFFSYRTPTDFALKDGALRFTSAVATPYPENNVVHARWFESPRARRRAVVIVPHWNADAGHLMALARIIRGLGISVLRLSPPYHDNRTPPETRRADYSVSPNIGRTVDATRQAVVDIRSCCDWLEQSGYERLGLVGISLGACHGFLAAAHDSRLAVNVFSHLGTSYADIVWTGVSTRHIRQGLESGIDLTLLREVWRLISPISYVAHFARTDRRSLFIRTTYDTTVVPIFSQELMEAGWRHGWPHREIVLPCGHYTSGEIPFKFLIGYYASSFLRRHL